MNSNIFNRLSFVSLLLVVVLLPLFFLPFTNISIESGKGLFLVIGLIVSVIFWIISRFSDGKVSIPRSPVLLAGGAVLLVTLFSAIFSGSRQMSLFGTMLDVGSFWFIFSALLLMLLSAIVFREPKNARIALFGILLSSVILLIFQTLHVFAPTVLSFGVLAGKTDNIFGSWNGLGIFIGFFVICCLFVIEFFPVSKGLKLLLGILTILSLIFISIVNFIFIWEIVGIFALLIFVYKISINAKEKQMTQEAGEGRESGEKTGFPILSFIVVLISLLFFISGQFIGGIMPSRLGIVNTEVGPSLVSTFSVTKSVILAHPALGMGPNRFTEAWSLYKPLAVNGSAFWDVSFNAGSGLLPTFIATTGLLGTLSWLLFFVLFIITGVKWLFSSLKNNVSLETLTFFFLSLYLFVSAFFYVTGAVMLLLAFVFAGAFIGLVASSRAQKEPGAEITWLFFNDHRKSFFFMLFLIVLTILSVGVGFKYIERFASIPYFNRTITATKVEDAQASIGKALSLSTNDLYLRTYAEVYLARLNSIVSKGAPSLSDTDKTDLQSSLDQAVTGAQAAIQYNPQNYLNFQMLGNVYQSAGLIGVKDGYDQALSAYQNASSFNPGNPRLRLLLATVSLAAGRTKDAKDYANQALTLKPDYIDALVVLSQIAKGEGDSAAALSYAEKALSLAPTNQDLVNYVNSLKNTGSPAPAATSTPANTSTSKNP